MIVIENNALSDEALMARIARSDAQSFAILVRRHQQQRILNLIYRSVGDRTQAEDVAQEVFLRVWRAAGEYEPKARFTTWVYRITVNLCLDALKEKHRQQPFVDLHVAAENWSDNDEVHGVRDSARSPEELLIDAEESDRVFAAIQGLPANQRMAVLLTRFEGLSYDEIGRILGCSVSAVESLLVRAKKTLRKIFF